MIQIYESSRQTPLYNNRKFNFRRRDVRRKCAKKRKQSETFKLSIIMENKSSLRLARIKTIFSSNVRKI
jgi:hypothetical protein